MKFIHLADIHLGKRLHEFPLLEDQRHIWHEIISIIHAEQPDAILLAGDIYDKPVPSAEAVQLFDEILSALAKTGAAILIISGNHDSAERLSFGARLMQSSNVYISPVFHGVPEPVILHDAYGEVRFYLLPFVRPAQVRAYFPDEPIDDYQDALHVVLSHIPLNPSVRNVMVTHQFVEGGELYGTEERAVGGTDQVCAELFEPFDYTALGHLHRPQSVGQEKIRYAGSPLKYSAAEALHEKTVTVGELSEKGTLNLREIPLHPLRDLRRIRGTYMELTERSYYAGTQTDDYLHITLTDEEDIPDAIGRLRTIYPNLICLTYDNMRTRENHVVTGDEPMSQHTSLDYMTALYQLQNNQSMQPEQEAFLTKLIEEIWEEKDTCDR